MPATPTTTMRLDPTLKALARPILDEMGINLTQATNLMLRAIIREGRLPFEVAGTGLAERYLAPLISTREPMERSTSDVVAMRSRLARRRDLIYSEAEIVE